MRRYMHFPASKTPAWRSLGTGGLYLVVCPILVEPCLNAGCRRTDPPMLGLKEPF